MITTWNTADMVDKITPITNCHNTLTQVFVEDDKLDMFTYQRSVDVICGLPHNLLQQWAFLMWLAHRTNKKVGELRWCGGDIHIYKEHYDVVDSMLVEYKKHLKGIKSGGPELSTPQLMYTPTSEEFLASDFKLDREYTPLLNIKAKMVV